tara:strand:+ start:2046 stop:2219 length:174 start_codon:yes stop_codon:yes gene_type:complete
MVKITEVEELKQQIQIAIDCLDNICSTHANSAAYRDMAKESLQQILLRKENAISNET